MNLFRSTNGGVMQSVRPGSRRLRSTRRFGAAFLILAALIGPGVIVLAQAPSPTTIPRVPNPPNPNDATSLPGDLRGVAVPGPSPENLNQKSRSLRHRPTRNRRQMRLRQSSRVRRSSGSYWCRQDF